MTVSAKRTVKRATDVAATAVTEFSRPLAASAGTAFSALAVDDKFLVALAWRADN